MPTNLKTHIENFQHWLKTDTGDAATWQKERQERLSWYRKHLARDYVVQLSEDEFATLIKDLWATNIWKNKDYKVEKLLKDNGLDKIQVSLDTLLHGKDPLEKRWDEFSMSVKGLGPSSTSEILTFSDPHAYALVNKKPYEVLPRIGLSVKPVGNGKSYKNGVGEIRKVKEELEKHGVKDADFILTDFFIAYLFYQVFDLQYKHKEEPAPPPTEIEPKTPPAEIPVAGDVAIESHEGAQAALLKLGKLLACDTYTADPAKEHNGEKLGDLATLEELPYFATKKAMDSAKRIDVVWLKGEWPEYFFEVEQSTGVTPGLHRMYQVIRVDAKFFIVAPGRERSRFEREVEKAPFKRSKHKYQFRSYEELGEMYLAASNFRKTRDTCFA